MRQIKQANRRFNPLSADKLTGEKEEGERKKVTKKRAPKRKTVHAHTHTQHSVEPIELLLSIYDYAAVKILSHPSCSNALVMCAGVAVWQKNLSQNWSA